MTANGLVVGGDMLMFDSILCGVKAYLNLMFHSAMYMNIQHSFAKCYGGIRTWII
jgi:hypothetical protein